MPFRKGEPPPNKDRTFPAEILTRAEVAAILAQCSRTAPTGIRDRALITVLYRAGLRVAEALDLKPSDIDPAAGTIRVLHGKGDRPRTVGVGDGALAVLQLWLDTRKRLGLRSRWLFCTLKGGRLRDTSVRAMLRRRTARAGVDKRVYPHVFRHTHANELRRGGTDVVAIQHQLGHKHLATTEIYLQDIAPADVIALGRADTWTDE
jgi:integrase/recombinase XerD